MGISTKSIAFFSNEITIIPHTASDGKYLDRPVSIQEFAGNAPVCLEQIESANNPAMIGEYIVRNFKTQEFMQGPEAPANNPNQLRNAGAI